MTKPTGVTSIRTVSAGTQALPKKQQVAHGLTMKEAAKKWGHLKNEVKDAPWSAVPDGMLRDFLLAARNTLMEVYGAGAEGKAAQMLAIGLAVRQAGAARLTAAWTGTPAGFELVVSSAPEAHDKEKEDPSVEFSLRVPEGADEAQVREGLRDWAAQPPSDRVTFDPLKQILAEDLAALVRQVEGWMGDQSLHRNQLDALMGSAAVLMIWAEMEKVNAATAEFKLAGLTVSRKEVAPGQEFVLKATRTPLEPMVAISDEEPTQVASIKHRLK